MFNTKHKENMKRIALLFLSLTMTCILAAQPHGKGQPFHKHKPDIKPLPSPTIIVQAINAESFFVYLNGDLMNPVPRTQVVIDRLDNNLQEVIVVLNHPAHKAAVVDVYADIAGAAVYVEYDHRSDQMIVTPPSTRMPRHDHSQLRRTPNINQPIVTPPVVVPEEPKIVSDEWVNEMVSILNNQSFDSEKSETAKGLLNNGLPFTSNQIARIAGTFTFTKGQVEFLKLAYTHCIDPENYEHALAVLTFSNDRQEVRNYINSLR